MNRLRNRLILVFLAATLAPLLATVWITSAGSGYLLDFSTTGESGYHFQIAGADRTGVLSARARRPEATRTERADLAPEKFRPPNRDAWPEAVKVFADSHEAERFVRAGNQGDQLHYLVRHDDARGAPGGEEIWQYSESLGGIAMDRLSQQIADARTLVEAAARARSAARVPADLYTAGDLVLAGLAGAAGLPGAPHQPAHPPVDRRLDRTGGRRPERARAAAPRRRNRPRHPGVQPHGRQAAREHRAAGLPAAARRAGRRWRARWRTR